jgi:hypothetical protein
MSKLIIIALVLCCCKVNGQRNHLSDFPTTKRTEGYFITVRDKKTGGFEDVKIPTELFATKEQFDYLLKRIESMQRLIDSLSMHVIIIDNKLKLKTLRTFHDEFGNEYIRK